MVYSKACVFVNSCPCLTLLAMYVRIPSSIAAGRGLSYLERLERVLRELDAGFSATLERHESEAANDLALSLKQDADLSETLSDGSGLSVWLEGHQMRVEAIGADHFVVDPGIWLIPFGRAVATKHFGSSPPRETGRTLLEELRARERHGVQVSCCLEDGVVDGRLAWCGRDHLALVRGDDELVVPLTSLRRIRLSHVGSTGVP